MRKIILTTALFFALGAVVSCSNEADNDVIVNDSANTISTARGSVWSGIIGEDKGSGVYTITADQSELRTDLEAVLAKEGDPVSLTSLTIVKRNSINIPSDAGFFLVGSNDLGVSIGVVLDRNSSGQFVMAPKVREFASTTSCRGCATGCNLQYLTIDGRKVPFCNENGCINDCEKSESNFL